VGPDRSRLLLRPLLLAQTDSQGKLQVRTTRTPSLSFRCSLIRSPCGAPHADIFLPARQAWTFCRLLSFRQRRLPSPSGLSLHLRLSPLARGPSRCMLLLLPPALQPSPTTADRSKHQVRPLCTPLSPLCLASRAPRPASTRSPPPWF